MLSFLSKVPLQRQILYVMSFGLLPVLLVGLCLLGDYANISGLFSTIEEVQYLTSVKEAKQSYNIAIRNHYREADHFYIDKYVESLTFLEPEVEHLQKITTHKNFTEDESIKQRLEFLTNTNHLIFAEGVVQSYPTFQETVESLVHTVEVNSNDLQKILATIEGIAMGSYAPGPSRPQLMITDFKLDKKKMTDGSEVFALDMKLLKREFI
jgi:hypothetical protein